MGWSIGYDENWCRDIGYGVPCVCDHPGCDAQIHRGIAHVCGGEPRGGEDGCGLFFCSKHLVLGVENKDHQVCERCAEGKEPFEPKPDAREWIEHKLNDPSWQQWRDENQTEVAELRATLKEQSHANTEGE